MAHAEPHRARPVPEVAAGQPRLDQVGVACHPAGKRKLRRRRSLGRAGRLRQRMPRHAGGQRHVQLALGQQREAPDLLALRQQRAEKWPALRPT
jgi:hypothetical protein